MTAVYAGFDRATLDRQYSPSSRVPGLPSIVDAYAALSARAHASLTVLADLRYGPGERMTLDYFPAPRPGAPLLAYLHGGYWQEMSKDYFAFPALDLVPAGGGYAVLGYELAPGRSLDGIVAGVRRGLWWLLRYAEELGAGRIHLAGTSAGAHLVAMALLDGWTPSGRHPADIFAGAILLSGVYDLEPIRHTYVNDALSLDAEAAHRNSPIRHLPDRLPPLLVARGGIETEEFARQQEELTAAAAGRLGGPVRDFVVAHRNHFDLTFDLADPATQLGRAVLTQLGLAGSPPYGTR